MGVSPLAGARRERRFVLPPAIARRVKFPAARAYVILELPLARFRKIVFCFLKDSP
jgi:hypothetical protein